MASKSATLLVFLIVACIAFCLACVCASFTGEINILPADNDTNITNVTPSFGSQEPTSDDSSQGYSSGSSSSYQSQSSSSNIETYTDSQSPDDSSSGSDSGSESGSVESYSEG